MEALAYRPTSLRAVHVGLNLIYLVPGETGGTETYARELIPELVAAAPEIRFSALINEEAAAAPAGAPWGELIPAITVPVRARRRVEWVRGEQLLLPRAAARAGVDLVHSLANTGPGWGAYRRVVSIHDLHFKRVPEAHLGLNGLGMRVLVPLAARRATSIITDSRSTAGDLRDLLHIPEDRIDVVPLGIGALPRAAPEPEAQLRAELGAGERAIVLAVAAQRPHKNLARLIEAVAGFPAARRPLLVIAGYPTSHGESLRRRISELGADDGVRLLGWVSPERLEGLYAACACVVCPSLHEGFGLPVLEAMVRGAPVACSDRGALAEVAGDAAIPFDPLAPASIAAAITRILDDPAEADRLRSRGREHAAGYSWAAAARGTLAAYERALASRA